MSAISTILARLRAAIWAIDVRDDIANAIEQCYSDVSNPTLKTEALEAALQTKIDQGEMAALTIGDGTLTGAKLANGTIPKAKLDPSITFDADAALDPTSTNAIQNKVVASEIGQVKADLGDKIASDIDASADLNTSFNRAFLNQMNNQETFYKMLLNSLYATDNASMFLGGNFNMFNLIENEYVVEKGKALAYRVDNVHIFQLVKIANQTAESTLRKRGLIYSKNNSAPTIVNEDNTASSISPIKIPAGSTLMYSRNAEELGIALIPAIMKYESDTGLYHRVIGYGWHISSIDGNAPHIFDLKPYNDGNHYLALSFRTADYEQIISNRGELAALSGEKTTSHNTDLDITDDMIATLNITII